jgi:hypothetical protein
VIEQVVELERRVNSEPGGASAGRPHSDQGADSARQQLRHTVGRSVLALAPPQVQQLHHALTSPQRALVKHAVNAVKELLLDRDRER